MRSSNKQLFSVVMLIFSIILITGCTFFSNSEVSDESTLIINESGSYILSDNYKVVEIEVGDVVIEDGNAEKVVIEQTVGDGEVTLNNINAQKLYVFGGGVNSVLLQEKTRINEIQVKREDGAVRIAIDDESIASNVTVAQGSQNVIIQGNIDMLKVEASDIEVTADKGHIRKAIIKNSNSSIIVGEDSKLDEGNIFEGTLGSKFVILGFGELLEVSGKENKVEVEGFLKKLIVSQKTDIVVNSNIDEVIFKDDAEESILTINAEGVVKLIRSNTKININGKGYVEKVVAIATKQVAGNSVIKAIKLQDDPFIDTNDLKEENRKTITNNVPKLDDNRQAVQNKELYKIKFIDFDGTLLKAIEVEKNGSAIPPKNPSRIGYSFKVWDKAFDNVTEDMNVFAYYEAKEYIIAFDENGGSEIEDIKGEFEKTISMPEDPNKEGYVVEGWYKNAALTDKWNFSKDTVPLNGLTLYVKWIVEDYSINYELNGGKNHFDAPTSYNIESEAISLKAPEKEGYMFIGWFDKNEGGNLFNEIVKGSLGDKVAYARWQAKSDTGYKIQHYKQNSNGEGYYLVETEAYQGVTDSSVESKAKSYDGFELNVNADGTLTRGKIKGDGSLTMKLYYDRIKYKVVFRDYDDSILKSEMVMYESDAKPPTAERSGYTFIDWSGTFDNVVSDITIKAVYEVNTDTAYKVEHYKQDVDGVGYTLAETQDLTGTTDTVATAEDKAYVGFTFDKDIEGTVQSGNVEGDGSLTLKLYYDRNEYSVVFKDHDGTVLKTESVLYEGDAAAPVAARTGYVFDGWDGMYEYITSSRVLTATYKPGTDTAYKVEHYKQDVDGVGYTLAETQDLTGTTDTVATAEDKAYVGFTFDKDIEGTVQSGNVEGDGSLTLKLYYDRNEYSVVFKDHDGTVLKTESVLYEGDAAAPVAARTGYVFDGWDGMYEHITSSRVLTATYKPGTDTAYKAEHYKQDVDGLGYTLAETQYLAGTTDTVATAEDKAYLGFTFDKDIEATVQSGNIEGDGSLVLKLYYDRNEYQISFGTGAGSLVETVSGVFGGLLLKPDDPTNEGHVFEGWYKDELFENKWDFNLDTIPASNITLYANWIKPSPNGMLLDADAGSDFIGVLFSKPDGNVYYIKSDKNSSWQQEVTIGLGTEGSIKVDASDNVHVAYVTDGKIAYTKFDGNSWSEKTYIESLNIGGAGACSKVDLAVDGDLSPHITYTDSRGTSDDYSHPDIMYAKLSEGTFSRNVIFRGYRDYSSSGSWGADYYNGGSSIAVNENGDYFIIAHRQNVWRWFAGTDNTYYIMIHSNLGTGSISNYGTNIYETYDLAYSNGKFVALYKDSTFKTSEIAVSGITASFINTTGIGGSSVASVSNNGVSTVVGGKSSAGTLLTHLDGLSQDHMINVKDNKVSVVYLDGEYYGVYRDNESSELKVKKL